MTTGRECSTSPWIEGFTVVDQPGPSSADVHEHPVTAGLHGAPATLSAPRTQSTRSASSAALVALNAVCATAPVMVVLSKGVLSAPTAQPPAGQVYMRRVVCAEA